MEAKTVIAARRATVKRPGVFRDLTGQRFGRLLVLSRAPNGISRGGRSKVFWNCICACTKEAVVQSNNLTTGNSQSCGCWQSELTVARQSTHGHSVRGKMTRTYECWESMIQRCTNPRCKAFSNYGGRGIKVCKRWRDSFEAFLADMGEKPTGLQIDRIENDGNYEPSNCKWATRKEEARNKRSNRHLTINGETRCLAEWSERSGIKSGTIRERIKAGRDLKSAIFEPLRK